ncbi:unnamed protein product [Effrenium voratum]|uniref:RRM domain-containing protein n=1 Tax=Effrenium voratum TaxID=2562239 RepID=A0AA36HR34_9DINO|nr:unnamed protein product [Effrenium voratum]CAJ1425049.1 unnamed protein product [Effrenium voratum]
MGKIPTEDPGEAAAAAAAAATAGALAKVAQAQAEKQAEVTISVSEPKEVPEGASGSAARFFVRGLGNLGEHHLKDYFEKFGHVVEASLVRDKKTQRPRGMAFVSLAPREAEDGPAPSMDDLIAKVAGAESHSIKGVEVEVQEAIPKPEEKEAERPRGPAVPTPPPVPTPQAQVLPAVDPQEQAKAQAQWQMHYLAMAINLSVPDVPGGKGGAPGGKGRPGPY